MERDKYIDYDLESTPLEVKTDSAAGSGDKLDLVFYDDDVYSNAGLSIYFTSPPQYRISDCSRERADFPTALPSEQDKIWRVTIVWRSSSAIQLQVHCNNVVVLDFMVSSSTCTYSGWSGAWSQKKVNMIALPTDDNASDQYRAYNPGNQISSISN